HEAWLGNSIEAIASEKAGILKAGVPAVVSPQRAEAEQVIRQRAAEAGAAVIDPRGRPGRDLGGEPYGSRFEMGELSIACPLAGEHQVENARTASVALLTLGVSREAIQSGIAVTRWPGRLERFGRDPEIIADGAHNPAGARALAAYVD